MAVLLPRLHRERAQSELDDICAADSISSIADTADDRLAAQENIRPSIGIPVPRHEQPLLMSPCKDWIGSEGGYSHLLLSVG